MSEPSIPFPARAAALVLALGALLLAAGCGGGAPTTVETDEPAYVEAKRLEREGRTQEALADYLKVIAKRADLAPESHLEVGLIDMDTIHDPIAAIYHFKKYLELEPNSPQAGLVRGRIDAAERNFARTLPGNLTDGQVGTVTSLAEVEALRDENSRLKAELAALRGEHAAPPPPVYAAPAASAPEQPMIDAPAPVEVVAAPAADAETSAAPAPAREQPAPAAPGRHYRVQAHDTLYGIAKKCYGSATNARVQSILQANRGVLPTASALRPGMELRIP